MLTAKLFTFCMIFQHVDMLQILSVRNYILTFSIQYGGQIKYFPSPSCFECICEAMRSNTSIIAINCFENQQFCYLIDGSINLTGFTISRGNSAYRIVKTITISSTESSISETTFVRSASTITFDSSMPAKIIPHPSETTTGETSEQTILEALKAGSSTIQQTLTMETQQTTDLTQFKGEPATEQTTTTTTTTSTTSCSHILSPGVLPCV